MICVNLKLFKKRKENLINFLFLCYFVFFVGKKYMFDNRRLNIDYF